MIPIPTHQFKIVLVGESSVGKSSILNRFVDDQFQESLLSTIGVDFKFRKMKVNGEEVKLQIWDTAGQETFRSIVSAYYNSSDAIIIVYDITSYRSIESVKDYWLGEASNNNKNSASIFLIGNKLDEGQTKREVQSFSVESVMESHQIERHFEVSAKTGENIEPAFIDICKVLISRRKGSTQPKLTTPQNNTNFKENPRENNPRLADNEAYKRNKCCPT